MNQSLLSPEAALVLELASRRDGYLAASSEVIAELRRDGLVMTQNVGDGFMMVHALARPSRRRRPNGQWGWTMEGVAL